MGGDWLTGDKNSNATGGGAAVAWLNAATKVSGAGLALVLYVVLARFMEPEAFAVVALVLTWQAVATALASLSMPLVVVRFVPEYLSSRRFAQAKGAVLFALFSSGVASAALAGGVAGLSALGMLPVGHQAGASVLLGCALLVVAVVTLVGAGFLQSRKQVVMAEVLGNVLRSALAVIAVTVLAYRLRESLPATTVLGVYLAASLVSAAGVVGWSLRNWPAQFWRVRARYHSRQWTQTGVAFMGVMVAATLNERVDLLIMGFIAPGSDVATYAVATRFSQTVIFATTAVAAVMAPHLVERLPQIRAGVIADATALTRSTARTTLAVCVVAFAAFAVLAPLFLPLFGGFYEAAYVPLVVLAAGHVAAALFGPAILVATLTGNSAVAILSLSLGIVVNGVINVNLVPELGALGAAIATAIAFPVGHLCAWLFMRRRLGIDSSVLARVAPSR